MSSLFRKLSDRMRQTKVSIVSINFRQRTIFLLRRMTLMLSLSYAVSSFSAPTSLCGVSMLAPCLIHVPVSSSLPSPLPATIHKTINDTSVRLQNFIGKKYQVPPPVSNVLAASAVVEEAII
eukprot:379411_1